MEIIKTAAEKKTNPTINSVPFGVALKRISDRSTVMRVKPTSYLLNSTVVTDTLNKGNVFIVNLITGTLFGISGTEEVIILDAKLVVE